MKKLLFGANCFFRCLQVVLLGIPVYYVIAVLFGAPLLSHFTATFFFAAVLSLFSLLPLAVAFSDLNRFDYFLEAIRESWPSCPLPTEVNLLEYATGSFSVGAIFGAWVGACFIPLDWDRWWQRWPLSCVFGTVIGALLFAAFGAINSLYLFLLTMTSMNMSSAFYYTERSFVPKLVGVMFAEFDSELGPILTYQVPSIIFSKKKFDSFSSAIIPKPDLFNRLVKVNHVITEDEKVYKVMGNPRGLESKKYPRGRYIFNLCFIVHKSSEIDCMYEPMVQKCNDYLTQLETDHEFLTKHKDQLPSLMSGIIEGLNNTGECKIAVTDETTVYLKLCPSFHGVEPPMVSPHMVPIFSRVPPLKDPEQLTKMDVLSQKICAKIDGVRCIKEIAKEVDIDPDLVARCVRNLQYFGVVALLPLFMYFNTYIATDRLHEFYKNKSLIEECLDFVAIHNCKGERIVPRPAFADVFRLYASLRVGVKLEDWYKQMNPRKYGVDEKRLIQFSIFHGFVRKLDLYPVALPREEDTRKIAESCGGSLSLDDFAAQYYTHPRKLYDSLLKENDFMFICR